MTRKIGALLVPACVLFACQHDDTEQEREQERLKIAAKSADVREEKRELEQAASGLDSLVDEACANVPEAEVGQCPITSRNVERATELDDGVQVQLQASVGTALDVERRVHCYRARRLQKDAQVKKPAIGASCVLDIASLSAIAVGVRDGDGSVQVTLTSTDSDVQRRLREGVMQKAAAR